MKNKLKVILPVVAVVVLAGSGVWLVFFGPLSITSQTMKTAEEPLGRAISEAKQVMPLIHNGETDAYCSHDHIKTKSSDCTVTSSYVSQQSGDAKKNLTEINEHFDRLGWDTLLADDLVDNYDETFMDPPSQEGESYALLSQPSYSKFIDSNTQLVMIIKILPNPEEPENLYYGQENTLARQALAQDTYYFHIKAIYSKRYSPIRYF